MRAETNEALIAIRNRLKNGGWDICEEHLDAFAAALDAAIQAEREGGDRLAEALREAMTDNAFNAYYHSGSERDGKWRHHFMSDGEWLERELGLPDSGEHDAEAVKAGIPKMVERHIAAIRSRK